jgi:hypothetical protein
VRDADVADDPDTTLLFTVMPPMILFMEAAAQNALRCIACKITVQCRQSEFFGGVALTDVRVVGDGARRMAALQRAAEAPQRKEED